MYERNTLSAPHPRRSNSGNSFNRNRGPKKPSGHQSSLTKYKGRASIRIDLLTEDRAISGRLVDSDRYTITVEDSNGVASRTQVIFKHGILAYTITPDETTDNE